MADNQFQIGVHLKIKFRAFKIDFGTAEKTFRVNVPSFTWGEYPHDKIPDDYKTLFNDKGVVLTVWLRPKTI